MLYLSMAINRRPSKQMLRLLDALSAAPREWRHGYDIMKETGLLSGTLYPLLMRMTDQGLVEAEWREPAQPGRPPRHAYRLTAQGLALARETAGERRLSGFKEVPV
jgi:DNA-binding PadR family transcriptional regulator